MGAVTSEAIQCPTCGEPAKRVIEYGYERGWTITSGPNALGEVGLSDDGFFYEGEPERTMLVCGNDHEWAMPPELLPRWNEEVTE